MSRETTQTGNWACPFVNSSSGPRWDLRPSPCPVKSLGLALSLPDVQAIHWLPEVSTQNARVNWDGSRERVEQSWEVCIANELIIFYSVRAKAISNLLANDSKRKRAESCLVKTAPFRSL